MRFALLLALAGCESVFGLDETQLPPPPPDAPGCSGGVFGSPVPLTTFDNNGLNESEPQLRHDLLELWFQVSASTDHLYWAKRASVDVPFDPPQAPPFADVNVDESDPTITGDGLRVLFASRRGGVQEIWEAVRPSLDAPFESPHLVGVGGNEYINSIDVSFDGLRLYIQFNSFGIQVAERPSLKMPFGTPRPIHPDAGFATVSPDERELFFNEQPSATVDGTDLFTVVRGSTADAWPTGATLVFKGGEDPDLAGDGRTLVVVRNASLVLFQRDCP